MAPYTPNVTVIAATSTAAALANGQRHVATIREMVLPAPIPGANGPAHPRKAVANPSMVRGNHWLIEYRFPSVKKTNRYR
jgi:hypothetical protein